MNRRTFIGVQLAGLSVVAFLARIEQREVPPDSVGHKHVGDDPAFDQRVQAITVDDVAVDNVFELNDREGWVRHYVMKRDGPVIDTANGPVQVKRSHVETVRGRVRIQYRARDPAHHASDAQAILQL